MMKDYRRMMEQVTLSDRKKEEIMEQLEHKSTRNKCIPRLAVIVLAAALLMGGLLCMAADIPDTFYSLMTGGTFIIRNPEGYGFIDHMEEEAESPVVLEDGRLWLTVNGETTDITDLIDENTPYIVESEPDPDSGFWSCLIVGGTPDNFGWVEAVAGSNYAGNENHLQIAPGHNYFYDVVELPDGSMATAYEISNGLGRTVGEANAAGFDWGPYTRTDDCTPDSPDYLGYIPGDTLYYPWLDAAIAQVDFRWG